MSAITTEGAVSAGNTLRTSRTLCTLRAGDALRACRAERTLHTLDTLNALAADGAVCIVGHEKAVQASGEEGLNMVSLG